MSIRSTVKAGIVALALGGTIIPWLSSEAQVTGGGTDTGTTRGATNDDGPDFGWIGVLGLAGLAGLMGRREDRTTMHRSSATATPR